MMVKSALRQVFEKFLSHALINVQVLHVIHSCSWWKNSSQAFASAGFGLHMLMWRKNDQSNKKTNKGVRDRKSVV